MKEYKGRKILKQLSACLLPGDSGLPDCICEILLTDDTLYVLEDEFNGEYTVHFAIPCSHIERIEKYIDTESRKNNGSAGEISPSRYALTAVFGLISGHIVLPDKKGDGKAVCAEYLRVIFTDGPGENRHLYFSEVVGNIKGFAKAFDKEQAARQQI